MPAVDLLVIGGTGLLGAELVRATTAKGRVAVATYNQTEPRGDGVWLHCDLGQTDVDALVRSVRPAAVVNAAYVPSGADLDTVTADAPGRLAAAAAEHEVRFVHISSDVVFPGTTLEPRVETDPVDPVTDYGRAKARAEVAVAAADPTAAIVRTSLLWGGLRPGAQEQLVADPAVTFFTNEVRCPIRVDRLATAVLEIVDRPEITGVLHVAGADAVDRLTFARHLAPLLGIDPSTLRGAVDATGTRPNEIVLDSSLARSLLTSPLPGVVAEAR